MTDFVDEARKAFGTSPFTARDALALLPVEVLPVQTQRIMNGSRGRSGTPAKSLGQYMARMAGIERVSGRTKLGIIWRVKP
jgi:hypothetical protein